jgi:prevent-host-death family protein
MRRVTEAEAKVRLSELIDAALHGEDVVIARQNTPVVRLTALKARKCTPQFGAFKGRIHIAPDFDQPLDAFAEYIPPVRSRRRR